MEEDLRHQNEVRAEEKKASMPSASWDERDAYIQAARGISRASREEEKRQKLVAKTAKIGNPFASSSYDRRQYRWGQRTPARNSYQQ